MHKSTLKEFNWKDIGLINKPELQYALDYWNSLMLEGKVSNSQAKRILKQLSPAQDMLLSYLREIENSKDIQVEEVHRRYPEVFKSIHVHKISELIVRMHPFNLLKGMNIGLNISALELWAGNFTTKDVLYRFSLIEKWMSKYHKTNHDGNILTPVIMKHLSEKGKIESKLSVLDDLKQKTRSGNFSIDNDLQRDLEFRRFVYEYTRVLEPLTYVLRGKYPPIMTDKEMYSIFVDLQPIEHGTKQEYTLNKKQLSECRRAAFEAYEFLSFLRKFRDTTDREIVVIGNDRFGRQWFVEPIEEYLRNGFSIRYDRVRSGTSTRLSVPGILPRSFIHEISENMPHIVIVDGSHAPSDTEVMQLSRALRDYANWFAVFNDLRDAEGNDLYKNEGSFPVLHYEELEKWHEYNAEKERIQGWVKPGQNYKVVSWSPDMKNYVMMGDEKIATQLVQFSETRPMVILANPIIYKTEGEDIDKVLRGTTPRYFDDPDQHVSDTVIFGFGKHGLETTRDGTSTEKFVSIVQEEIKVEIQRLEAMS